MLAAAAGIHIRAPYAYSRASAVLSDAHLHTLRGAVHLLPFTFALLGDLLLLVRALPLLLLAPLLSPPTVLLLLPNPPSPSPSTSAGLLRWWWLRSTGGRCCHREADEGSE